MTEVEKWVYSRHRTIFGAIFLDSYIKKEIRKAIKKGNVVEYKEVLDKELPNCFVEGKIVYGTDTFDDVIILEASGAAQNLSLKEQKRYVRPQVLI